MTETTDMVPTDQPGPMVLAIQGKGPLPEFDTDRARERINRQLLDATSPEQLLEAGQALGFDDLLGVPIEVHEAYLAKSTFEGDGPPVFMVLEALRGDTGEQIVVTTSAENVLYRVAIAADRGWLPLRFKVEKNDRPTAKGYTAYVVRPV